MKILCRLLPALAVENAQSYACGSPDSADAIFCKIEDAGRWHSFFRAEVANLSVFPDAGATAHITEPE
jgi:hypothetical protein